MFLVWCGLQKTRTGERGRGLLTKGRWRWVVFFCLQFKSRFTASPHFGLRDRNDDVAIARFALHS